MPALTCSAQATYLTGSLPSEHGIVGNGWYDRTLNEHHFWKQSNRLVGGPKIWEKLRAERPGFRTANLFWWFNMYSSVDYSITPRPLYRSDGLKTFDVHAHPLKIREEVNATSVPFPFIPFGAESRDRVINGSPNRPNGRKIDTNPTFRWFICPTSIMTCKSSDRKIPVFPSPSGNRSSRRRPDRLLRKKGVRVAILSEYGITKANQVVFPNRIFRRNGWLNIKDELGLGTLGLRRIPSVRPDRPPSCPRLPQPQGRCFPRQSKKRPWRKRRGFLQF